MECRVCKCTDENSCEGGCAWFEPGLCSICALAAEALAEWRIRAVSTNPIALILESERRVAIALDVADEDPVEPLIVIP